MMTVVLAAASTTYVHVSKFGSRKYSKPMATSAPLKPNIPACTCARSTPSSMAVAVLVAVPSSTAQPNTLAL